MILGMAMAIDGVPQELRHYNFSFRRYISFRAIASFLTRLPLPINT